VVRTFTSSAVRIVQAAIEKGIDITGGIIFTGGEPLTEGRLRFINSAGLNAFPYYAATETGFIAASCGNRIYPDDMHVYTDRYAVIQRHRKTAIGEHSVNTYLLTSLSSNTGKVLLNTEIGDFGRLNIERCSCLLGNLGMDVHISEVRSYDKLTGEGMTLLGSELDKIVGEMIEKAGGSPDDYQFWETS
jgi:phenylacetate-coenzyme A ligase PaaK-like adenylate-forming protein